MRRRVMIKKFLAVGLACGCLVIAGVVSAQNQSLVLENFQAKEADGFPSNWEHENQRSQSKGRDAYKVQAENGVNFLAAKDAGQRIKKKRSIGIRRPFQFSLGVGVCKRPRPKMSLLRRSMHPRSEEHTSELQSLA